VERKVQSKRRVRENVRQKGEIVWAIITRVRENVRQKGEIVWAIIRIVCKY
jgi:hypothetical protein